MEWKETCYSEHHSHGIGVQKATCPSSPSSIGNYPVTPAVRNSLLSHNFLWKMAASAASDMVYFTIAQDMKEYIVSILPKIASPAEFQQLSLKMKGDLEAGKGSTSSRFIYEEI